MIRNVIGIIFFIISGFFVYTIGLLAFFNFPDIGDKKILIMGGLCIPFLIFHSIGLAFYKGKNWKIPTGITLFVGGAFNIFIVITMLSIKGSPEIVEVVDMNGIDSFSDYISGFIVIAVFTGLGSFLYWQGVTANKPHHKDAADAAPM